MVVVYDPDKTFRKTFVSLPLNRQRRLRILGKEIDAIMRMGGYKNGI